MLAKFILFEIFVVSHILMLLFVLFFFLVPVKKLEGQNTLPSMNVSRVHIKLMFCLEKAKKDRRSLRRKKVFATYGVFSKQNGLP